MAEFKLSINDPKTGKSYKVEVKDDAAVALVGKKIGDKIKGDSVNMTGYEFEVSGGSDKCGFPMRKDVNTPRAKILAVAGTGIKSAEKGMRQRKTMCGNNIMDSISQVNLKILKYGKAKLGEPITQESAEAEKPAKQAKEAAKPEEQPKEEKPVEQPEEHPEEKPKKDQSAEDKPAEDQPAEDQPAEDQPSEDKPKEDN